MRYFLLLIFSVLVFYGCSRKSAAVKSRSSDDLYNTHIVGGDIPFVTDGEKKGGGKISLPRERRTVAPYAITFPDSETQHVRITAHDPFTNGETIEFDVAAMRDEFCYPYYGKLLSAYGMRGSSMHTGIDIKAVPNDTIRCVLPGVVRMSKDYSGYGNVVVVRHYNGLESVYSHNSKNLVKPNDVVWAGTPLALAGRTGRATTEHLHFELRVMGQHFDPMLLLDPQRQCLCGGILTLTKRKGQIVAANPMSSSYVNPVTGTLVSESISSSSGAVAGETYTVVKGDTLYSISRRFRVSVADLCRLNGISSNATLHIGKRLIVR